jgi:uncharacterized protein (DUF58 family)
MSSRAQTLLLITFGLLLGALLSHQGSLAWMALPFLAYLAAGLLLAPTAGKISLRASRSVEMHQAAGTTAVTVKVAVTNQGVALPRLCLSDLHQEGMHRLKGQLLQPAALQPGEEAAFQYTFQAGRGSFTWKTLRVEAGDPLGLADVRLEVPAAAAIQVLPELRRNRPFPLRVQRTLPSAGSIPARRGGSGTDFWGVREYQPGDPLRRLDWRLTARHPRRLFTKEFEQESLADIGLIVDARSKTNLQNGDDCLFEYSARAAASLAESFLRMGNRVSLLIWGEPAISVFPGCGKRQLNRILRALAQASIASDGSLDDLHFVPTRMFSSHSLILVITPLASNDWRLFPRLRGHGYQVLVICPDPFDYARHMLPADESTRLAARLARLERQLEIAKVAALWIPVVNWAVSQPLAPLVRQALRSAHIQFSRQAQ